MAKAFKFPRVLFFIEGASPTEEEAADARELAQTGHDILFRNASKISDDGCIEAFDDVAGSVPRSYMLAKEGKLTDQVRLAFTPSDLPPEKEGKAEHRKQAKAAARGDTPTEAGQDGGGRDFRDMVAEAQAKGAAPAQSGGWNPGQSQSGGWTPNA